ncbi:MAG: hypothetical protein JSW08_01270 [archaeon]|nr:MAG: hypothetical protein JSW08_01270 [archaeon]
MDGRNAHSVSALLSDFSVRINDLEERIKLMHDRVSILDQTMLKQNDRLLKEIKSIKDDIFNLKGKMDKFEDASKHLIAESAEFARKEELAVFDKFMKTWEPMNFATIDDVKEMLNEHSKKRKSKDKIIPVEE